MLRCYLLIFLVASSLLPLRAQEPEAKAPAPPKPLLSTATLPAGYPVITLPGFCPGKTRTAARSECKTVVTRAEFERLVNAIDPRMPKYERKELAQNYGRTIILAHRAEERGMDKEPRIQELLRYSRLRILATELSQEVYRDSTRITPDELTKYYEGHKPLFERFTVQRIVVPREKQGVEESEDEAAPAGEAEMKALAESAHGRALAGEDFDKLQQEVFTASGMTGKANTTITDLNRESLPPPHNQIFDLPAGAISPVLSDSNSYFVYKIVSREVPPLEKVKEQADLRLQRQKGFDALKQIQNSAQPEVNQTYFDKYDPPAPNPHEPEAEND